MELYINNEKVDYKLEGEEKPTDIIKGVESWLSSQNLAIDEILINDEKHFYSPEDKHIEEIPVSDIKTIKIKTVSFEENAFSMLFEAYAYLNKVLAFSREKDEKAFADMREGLTWAINASTRSMAILGLDSKVFNLNENVKNINILNERLSNVLENESEGSAISFFEKEMREEIWNMARVLESSLASAEIKLIKTVGAEISEENAVERLNMLIDLIEPLVALLEKTVTSLQTGKDKEALVGIEKMSEGLQSLFHVLSVIKQKFALDYSSISIDGKSFEEMSEELKSSFEEILTAFENEDYVTVSDLFEYEIKERLMAYTSYIEKIIEMLSNG